jgi:ribosomal protein S18 acetylase RimI-like enzyme
MEYEVRPLTPEMSECFADYLENLDFSHAPHWASCYCRYYHLDCTGEEWMKRTGQENRSEAVKEIKAGNMKGYLAFSDDKCIGWCNANDLHNYLRLKNSFDSIVRNQKVGCVICFVIHPQYRRKGVARALLKKAVEGFSAQGYDAVLALPVENKGEPQKLYRGTLKMYRENGFEEIEKRGDLSIMLLKL